VNFLYIILDDFETDSKPEVYSLKTCHLLSKVSDSIRLSKIRLVKNLNFLLDHLYHLHKLSSFDIMFRFISKAIINNFVPFQQFF
jgi:hypothetical protein